MPNLRVSKYDSYIRKLKAGHSIDKVIGRKTSASQKIRDIISSQIQRKHHNGGSGPAGEKEKPMGIINVGTITGSRAGDEDNLPIVDADEKLDMPGLNRGFRRLSKYTSKYDYFIEQLQKSGGKVDPEIAAAAANAAAMDASELGEPQEGATAQDLVTAEYIKSAFGFPPAGQIKEEPGSGSEGKTAGGKDRNGLPADMSLCNKYIARYG